MPARSNTLVGMTRSIPAKLGLGVLLIAFGCDEVFLLGAEQAPDVSAAGAGAEDESDGTIDVSATVNGDPGDLSTSVGGSFAAGSATTTGSTDAPNFACDQVASQQFDPNFMQEYRVSEDVAAEVEGMLALMSPAARASQMLGVDFTARDYADIHRSPDVQVDRLGTIRGYRYREGGRGVNLASGQDNRPDDGNNFATVFPTTSIRAASWDLALEKRVGAAIGDEVVASSNNVLLAPSMNLIRHPYWGRTQETYGEDGYHVGRMATAFTVGVQEYVLACANHFVAHNAETDRESQDAVMNEQTLREIYARHFEMVVQDGAVGCVVAAYQLVNHQKATQNRHLLRDVLKGGIEEGGMGFQGFVLSDWWALPGDQTVPDAPLAQAVTTDAVLAGTDVEMPWTLHYSEATLANVDSGLVHEAARRILTQKLRFETARDTDAWGKKPATSTLTYGSISPNEAHEALAEEALVKSAVLLQNGLPGDPVLPLIQGSIAVVGPDQEFSLTNSSLPTSCGAVASQDPCTFHFATDPALGDRGTSRVNADPARAVGPFQGIRSIAGDSRTVTSGNTPEAAADADAVVVVVGYSPADEGEVYAIEGGGDRASLDLPPGQNEFVSSVLDLNKPTVIIVESGSIVNLPWLTHPNERQATLWAGYPGLRGGLALGRLIFGQANFSGKMPLAWPFEEELPVFKDSATATNMGYFFGYREYDRRKYVAGEAIDLVFPFGHGLSYSTFEYSHLTVPCETVTSDAVFEVLVDITNTSDVDGDEVAFLFVKPPPKPSGTSGERPWKELKSFVRVSVPARASVTASLPVRVRDLRRWEGGESGRWVVDSGEYTILVGKDAEDAETTSTRGAFSVDAD